MFALTVTVLLLVALSIVHTERAYSHLTLKNKEGWISLGKPPVNQQLVTKTDFGGVTLKIMATKVGYLLDFADNDTKITGVYGAIWETLAEKLNFSLRVKRLCRRGFGMQQPNGSWDGLVGYLQRGEAHIAPRLFMRSERLQVAHYVQPFGYSGHHLFMRAMSPQISWRWSLLPFSTPLWVAIVGMAFSVAMATYACGWLTNKWLPGGCHNVDFWRDLLHVWGFFCCQGHRWHQHWAAGHVLLTASLLAASILYQAYSAQLVTFLAFRSSWEPPFTSLREMASREHDYKVAVVDTTTLHATMKDTTDDFLAHIWQNYFTTVASIEDGVQLACQSHTAFLAFPEHVLTTQPPCRLEIVSRQQFLPTLISSGIVKNFRHKKVLDISTEEDCWMCSFLRLREVGVLRRLIIFHVHLNRKQHRHHQHGGTRTDQMEFEHVQPILLLYCMALCASLALLLAELLHSNWSSASRRNRVTVSTVPHADFKI